MVQKVIRKIISGISIALIIFSIMVLMTVVFTRNGQAPSIFGYSVFRVLTGSMEPEYPVDAVLLTKNCGPEEIREGDVISYYTTDPEISGSIVTHRVVQVIQDGDRIFFITKGDANIIEDAYPVDYDNLIGKVVGSSLVLGKIIRLLNNPLIFVLFILIPMIIILILNIKQTIETAKQLADEEMKQEPGTEQKEETEKILQQARDPEKDHETNPEKTES